MSTQIFRVDRPDDPQIIDAAQIVQRGGLVAFPTETVYGLAADAHQPGAIARLNRVKGRSPEKPYTVHLHDAAQLREFARDVPPAAQRLIDRFWPGPLTIVMPVDDGQMVGFRLPDHPVSRAFLLACGGRVVAPSANRAGALPPVVPDRIIESLGGEIDALLDAGAVPVGRESTVVQVVGDRIRVLREGAVPVTEIVSA